MVFHDQRRVNGVVLRFLTIEAELTTVPMGYCGYFYSGETGTVQVATDTEKARFPEYEKDFLDLLNGFTVVR